jgi:hypothetical protein
MVARRERREQQEQLRPHLAGKRRVVDTWGFEPVDVILALITYFQKDQTTLIPPEVQLRLLYVDEAHVLKNPMELGTSH